MRLRSTSTFLLLLVSFFLHLLLFLSVIDARSKTQCIEKEKQALLDFKLSFVNGTVSSWSIDNDDCCTWHGVGCDNNTGYVTSLDIRFLDGYQLRPSLLELQHLKSLEIENDNDQLTMRIPKFIGSLSELIDLTLFGFSGEIPPHLGNISKLQTLTLGFYDPSKSNGVYAHRLKWLSHLSFLKSLYLGGTNLTNAIDWASTIKMLPTLSTFDCVSCSLPPPSISSTYHANFSTTLKSLFLSNNIVSSSTISYLISTTKNLHVLWLDNMKSGLNIDREFLKSLTKARYSLEYLSLVGNNLSSLPFGGMMFPSLAYLDASSNQLKGSLSEILQYLSPNLTYLDLSSNLLGGLIILDAHFSKFSNLDELDLSDNLLTVNFSEDWLPPFQLSELTLRSCKVGPSFPSWILTQKNLQDLDLSNNMISGSIPGSFITLSNALHSFNLSHNKISFFPNLDLSISFKFLRILDLSHNSFHGPIPHVLFKPVFLDLSNNTFSKFPTFHQTSPNFNLVSQRLINLANNNLSGSLPNWFSTLNNLLVLNLENNKLSGTLPKTVGFYNQLLGLHLSNNMFSGLLPLSMKNCTHLTTLELVNNKFSGVVPSWLGESMSYLTILNLRSNDFFGDIPSSLCNLQSLQILDLSDNQLSGAIPICLHNFSSMATNDGLVSPFFVEDTSTIVREYYVFASIIWKGALVELYSMGLKERYVINLSGNLLRGEIPIGITTLKGLRSLDLSRNFLNGSIPDKIGQLAVLELLKLSSNRLSGEIPQSLADLTFLEILNVSNNNLSGQIPTGTQLQGFDYSSFDGNPKLCGQPLPTKCPGDKDDDNKQSQTATKDAYGEDNGCFDIQAFFAALGMGFVVGFLGILGSLHFIRPWRLAFFQLVNNITDKIIVTTYICIFKKGM